MASSNSINPTESAPQSVKKLQPFAIACTIIVSLICAIGAAFVLQSNFAPYLKKRDTANDSSNSSSQQGSTKSPPKTAASSVSNGNETVPIRHWEDNVTEDAQNDFVQLQSRITQIEGTSLALNGRAVNSDSISLIAGSPISSLSLRNCVLVDPQLNQLSNLTELLMVGMELTQKDLDDVCRKRNGKLKFLSLSRSTKDLTNLSPILNLENLQVLDLTESKVDDAFVQKLVKLPHLIVLFLNDCTSVSDAALSAMSQSRLIRLSLAHTHITDKGLESIQEMRNLQLLDLESTVVTAGGINKLCSSTKSGNLNVVAVEKCAYISASDLSQLQTRFPNIKFAKPPVKNFATESTESEK